MFIAASLTVAKAWKHPKCPLPDDRIKIHTVEYDSAVTKDEILPFESTQMDLQSITVREISQMEKGKDHPISLLCGI